ncbi:hypothetical protein OSB04_002071 [Centaurea solstitialis]|uniref:Reverse transcriptase domain-containing protein n=1 Tax=Centaurea solstitialis TaxID=347529 RepID=A0AA38WT02_9ASTR|nr:hypothetical protein OSB04_002071 [Centaurea solstitialis]
MFLYPSIPNSTVHVGKPTERVSVFNRLSPQLSFAAVVGEKTNVGLEYFPLLDRKANSINIPIELAREAAKAYHTTVVGYFLGSRVPFPIVQRSLRSAWGKYGLDDIMMNNNGGQHCAIEEGMIMIRNVPMFVGPWDPSKGLARPSHESCPLWVKFHNVPLVLFNQEGISRIASALGVPKRMDACTASMCDKKWGRPGFAKVLIDVWATGELKRDLEVVIPHLHDEGVDKIKIGVEYLWEPNQCSLCCVFGHKHSSCVKAVRTTKGEQKKPQMDADGFVRVERKQWRKKEPVVMESTKNDKEASSSGSKDCGSPELIAIQEEVIEVPVEGQEVADAVDVETVTTSTMPSVSTPRVVEENEKSEMDKAVDRKHLGLEFVMPEPAGLVVDDKVVSPTHQPSVVVPPRAPIKGILKNTSRIAIGGIPRKDSREAREELGLKSKDLDDKGGKGSQGKENSSRQQFSVGNGKSGIAAWNIRGLNSPNKQKEVRDFIGTNGVSIFAALETHVRADYLHTVCGGVFRLWPWFSNHVYSTTGTRIIVAWNSREVDVMALENKEQFMHCEVKVRNSDTRFFISFVYGANREGDRAELWSGLRKFKAIIGDKPWAVLGDFNAMLFPHDALGGVSSRNAAMASFFSCVEDIEMFDAHYTGIQFTWCQKPAEGGGLMRKLDRVLVNSEFVELFPDSGARFFPRGISDHSPAVLSFKADFRLKGVPFKFDNFLVDHPKFLDTVASIWTQNMEGTFMFRVTQKLKALKAPLRKLRGPYGNLAKRVSDLKHELEVVQLACDLDPFSVELRDDLAALRVSYVNACKDQEVALKQRAKVKWMREGDANTKFFHHVVREKRHSNQVHAIAKADGSYVYDDLVLEAFVDHFKSFMGTSDLDVIPDCFTGNVSTCLSVSVANHMIRPISDEEIRVAMFGIGNDKAPGSDGFSSKFFKSAWGIVGNDIIVAIHNFFYRGRLAKQLNHTLLCMLPKKPNASSVTDFRPIACCTVLYKCISKIVVDRIKPVLDSLVGNYQSAFIPGRRIVDNILMAHELVVGYQKHCGPPKCAFKIDIRKAYDMVDWRFLIMMLRKFGFHPVLVKWVEEMISTPTYSVALNGITKGFFPAARGIRQGDPLSPYLFTLVMEGFSLIFKQCVSEAEGFGYHHGCEPLGITHLCFADDLFVFTRGDVASVEVLKKALFLFASCSGLAPSLEKSEVFFGNVASDEQHAILNCLEFSKGCFPIRYLGVPLSPVYLKISDYGPLVLKVRNRIHNWKSKFLSYAGRKQLIASVLQSLQLYWMGVFLLPSVVVHELEALFRDFLWAHGSSSRGRCRVAWSDVCKPKECGGLGLRRLATWNRALVARNLWDVIATRDTMWTDWIKRYYIQSLGFWSCTKKPKWSWVFRKMMDLRDMVRRFVRWRVGNGLDIHAWEDHWLPCGPLVRLVSYRVIHASGFATNASVSDFIQISEGAWPGEWVSRSPQLVPCVMPHLQPMVKDTVQWDDGDHGMVEFSVAHAYASFDGSHNKVSWTHMVWYKDHIPKYSFCLWMACLRRLPTQDRLRSWKDDPPDRKCSLCGVCEDSHDHLFFTCPFSATVWSKVKLEFQWHSFPDRWDLILMSISNPDTHKTPFTFRVLLAVAVYMVWRERNARLFSADRRSVEKVVRDIVTVVRARVELRSRSAALLDT